MPDYVLVANTEAGSAEDEAVERVCAVLGATGAVEVARTGSTDDLAAVIDALGDRCLVVAGGDGSVHAVVQALGEAGRLSPDHPLGLVPLGTGNDVARALGLPLDPLEAAQVVVSGRVRPMDLIVDDDGGVVVNAVHVGVGAEAADLAADWKDLLGPLAYPASAAAAGTTSRGWDLAVVVDGEILVSQRLLMVGLGNGSSIGGGTPLAPSAHPADGRMDVVVSSATGPFARVGYALAMRSGDHVDRDDVVVVRGTRVTVSGEEFPVNADGELSGPFTRRTWTVEPQRWSVLA